MTIPPKEGSKDDFAGGAATGATTSDADLAQAFKDLARGEKTAQALEANLTNLEKKIDDLLASFEDKTDTDAEDASRPAVGRGRAEDGDGNADGDATEANSESKDQVKKE
ncbi:hypothetical protein PVAG01_05597 [Phlyctema vagabunda]|uniref:Uncharacterized protein n=1 Tax=Phlyctema vagabunda TaxID=108571 RepID=A0ABR4PKK4_9HELO